MVEIPAIVTERSTTGRMIYVVLRTKSINVALNTYLTNRAVHSQLDSALKGHVGRQRAEVRTDRNMVH